MWYAVKNPETVETPALAVYPERIAHNIQTTMRLVRGDASRLCPHVKTHKMARVMDLYLQHGIRNFKCATISEMEMVARSQADSALLAYQPVGPNANRLVQLANEYPNVAMSAVIDSEHGLDQLAQAAQQLRPELILSVLLDVDVGMGRTGIKPSPEAETLYARIAELPRLTPGGLHVYDGHIHDADFECRREHVDRCFGPAQELRRRLLAGGQSVPRVIAGGSPSFPAHAAFPDRICSPGTTIFWDSGYADAFPDMDFLPAAVLLTRVVSRLGPDRVCLDLGHKAVAAERTPPRVQFPDFPNAQEDVHSEEHLVIAGFDGTLDVGELVYAIPKHICPTVALHREALVVEGQMVVDAWQVTARDRKLSI